MITTYSELKTSIANWLHRIDLEAVIPDFITAAEARFNRVLAVSKMEQEDAMITVVNSDVMATPALLQNPIALWCTHFTRRDKLVYLQPQDLPYASVSGYPNYWTIDGGNIKFDRPSNLAYSMLFRYYKKVQLSTTNPTNWLLDSEPDLYLYAALMEAAPYLADDQRIAVWESRYEKALKEVKDNENATKSMAILVTDVAPVWNRRFDINRGY